jgi:hypothetical protein
MPPPPLEKNRGHGRKLPDTHRRRPNLYLTPSCESSSQSLEGLNLDQPTPLSLAYMGGSQHTRAMEILYAAENNFDRQVETRHGNGNLYILFVGIRGT